MYTYISYVHGGRELVIRSHDVANMFAMLCFGMDRYDGFIREHIVMTELQRFMKKNIYIYTYLTGEVCIYMCVCVLIIYNRLTILLIISNRLKYMTVTS